MGCTRGVANLKMVFSKFRWGTRATKPGSWCWIEYNPRGSTPIEPARTVGIRSRTLQEAGTKWPNGAAT